jgi:endonuclease/exonuclease/phosphatase family metal-dependent hydrolase
MKLLDLNVWNYNDFERRKPLIVNFIKKYNTDIIAFQEINDDPRYNSKSNNQANQINDAIGRKFGYECIFMKTMEKDTDGVHIVSGIAILSRIKIIKVSKIKLKKHPDDKYDRGILHIKTKEFDLINVHFSPGDNFAKLHLLETLEYVKRANINPIIVGDFNFRDAKTITEIDLKNFRISTDFKEYISKPPYTLDYILIPKNFTFKSFSCIEANLSDHKALLSEINLKS